MWVKVDLRRWRNLENCPDYTLIQAGWSGAPWEFLHSAAPPFFSEETVIARRAFFAQTWHFTVGDLSLSKTMHSKVIAIAMAIVTLAQNVRCL